MSSLRTQNLRAPGPGGAKEGGETRGTLYSTAETDTIAYNGLGVKLYLVSSGRPSLSAVVTGCPRGVLGHR